MSGEPLLSSNFAPEALYANFEDFLEGHQAMVRLHGMEYVLTYMLVRLAREDLEKGRRVFDWAVKRVCLNMLADDRFRPKAQNLSTKGLDWANWAQQNFGHNPLRSMSLVEGVFLLERLAVWAEEKLQMEFRRGGYTLLEFRKRPESNAEAAGKTAWIDLFYQMARGRAIDDTVLFVKRRDAAIALCVTALAGDFLPHDDEIDDAMGAIFPTHQLLKARRSLRGSLVDQEVVLEWVLGPHQKDIVF